MPTARAGGHSLKSRLALRFALASACAVGLALAVFVVVATVSYRDLTDAYEASAEQSLLEKIGDSGASASMFLANSMADPLYNNALEQVEPLVVVVNRMPAIADVVVYDGNGMLLFDGSGTMDRFGEMAPAILLSAPDHLLTRRWQDNTLKHFANRICIMDACFGWAVVAMELGRVKSEAAAITGRLTDAKDEALSRMVLVGVGLLGAMVAASALFGAAVSRPFARSLGAAVEALGALARGERRDAGLAFVDPAFLTLSRAVENLAQDLDSTDKSRAAILAAMQEGVVAMTAEGEIGLQNPAFVSMFGHHGHAFAQTLFGLSPHLAGRDLIEALGRVETLEHAESGALLDVMVRADFIGDAGEAQGIVAVVSDVSERAARERELEEAMRRAEDGDRAKQEFLASMSHEIRTPLNGVLGMLSMMKSSELTPTQAEQAEIAERSGRELLRLLNDILDVSKLEAGRVDLVAGPVDVARITRDVASLFEAQGLLKDVSVRAAVSKRLPALIETDEMRLRQVLMNLVGNAVKFTDRGAVTITVDWSDSAPEGVLRVEVRDTGIGVPPEARQRIFERFSQADSSETRRFGGTGLGLAICARIVALMEGSIGVHDNPGGGAVFRFEVPVRIAAAAAAPVEPVRQETAGPLHLLVAEDNAINQMVIRVMLERLGHTLHIVDDGAKAVEAVREGAFDAVLMDIQMPVMDGVTAMRAIRTSPPPLADIPIIAMTANAMAGDQSRYLADGMDGYVSKPIDIDRLQEALAGAVAARAGEAWGERRCSA